MIAEINELSDYPGTMWGDGRSFGSSWYGPVNNAAWTLALEMFPHPQPLQIRHLEQHMRTTGHIPWPNSFLQYASRTGMRGLTSNQILHMIWILYPDSKFADSRFGMYDPVMLDRFKTMLVIFSTPPTVFVRRSSEPWAKSFRWLHRRVEKLPTARFINRGIEVTGSSGNVYHIVPKEGFPHYQVRRIHNNDSVFVCIDPHPRAKNHVFGDILVGLTLALANDKQTALHIHTLQEHVFGFRANFRHYQRRRNIPFDYLYARAHGTAPVQGTEHDHLVDWTNRMRHLVNRFQTRLIDYDMEGEEE